VLRHGPVWRCGDPHAAANVIQGNVRDGHLRFAGQALAGADHIGEGEPAQAYIRPHDVRVSSTRNNGDSVAASLDRSNNLGWMSKLHLRLDDGQTLIAHVPNEDLGQHQPGDRVWVDLRNAKIFAPADGEAPSEPADGGIRAVV